MPNGTLLLLIRHGETDWNRIKRIQGQIDIGLSPVGERQVALLATRIAAERAIRPVPGGEEGVDGGAAPSVVPAVLGPIDAVVSSDLARALRTASPIAAAAGVAVTIDAGLRERHYGVFQGHDAAAIRARWPDAHARWIAHDPDFAPEGGESLRRFYDRVTRTLAAIARRHRGGTVACVAHGGVLDCAYRFASAQPLHTPRVGPVLNASVNRILWHGVLDGAEDTGASVHVDRAEVLAWADVAHLAGQVDARDDG